MSPERSVTYVSGTDMKRLVGERGFEPPTPWSRTRCSTRLSHSPTLAGTPFYYTRRIACEAGAKTNYFFSARNARSKVRVISAVDGNSAQLVAGHAHRPALVELIFSLHDFLLGLSDVSRKGEQEIFRYTLRRCLRREIVLERRGTGGSAFTPANCALSSAPSRMAKPIQYNQMSKAMAPPNAP